MNGSCSKLSNFQFDLGEGLFFNAELETLFWVDISNSTLQSLHLPTGTYNQFGGVPEASSVLYADALIIMATGRHSVWKICRRTGEIDPIFTLEAEHKDNRCNEAKIDPFGNIWIGTMNRNESRATGSLWKIDPHFNATKVLNGLGIPNTLLWDVKRDRFYYADSMLGVIFVDSINEGKAKLGKSIFFDKNPRLGVPDGSTLDQHGNIYNARWGAASIIAIDSSGKLLQQIVVPAKFPTSCVFIEDGTLAITTAKNDSPTSIDGCLLKLLI